MRLHEFLVLIAYAKKPPINAHANVSSWARALTFGLSFPLGPNIVYARSEGSGETAHSLLAYVISTQVSTCFLYGVITPMSSGLTLLSSQPRILCRYLTTCTVSTGLNQEGLFPSRKSSP